LPRPHKRRQVSITPPFNIYKPIGARMTNLEAVNLKIDEVEAMQLAHLEGYYQEAIAERMGISRQTEARIPKSAHQKVTDALVTGKVLLLEDNPAKNSPPVGALCPRCGNSHGCEHPEKRRVHGRCHRFVAK